jgi:hypothetical protein
VTDTQTTLVEKGPGCTATVESTLDKYEPGVRCEPNPCEVRIEMVARGQTVISATQCPDDYPMTGGSEPAVEGDRMYAQTVSSGVVCTTEYRRR